MADLLDSADGQWLDILSPAATDKQDDSGGDWLLQGDDLGDLINSLPPEPKRADRSLVSGGADLSEAMSIAQTRTPPGTDRKGYFGEGQVFADEGQAKQIDETAKMTADAFKGMMDIYADPKSTKEARKEAYDKYHQLYDEEQGLRYDLGQVKDKSSYRAQPAMR